VGTEVENDSETWTRVVGGEAMNFAEDYLGIITSSGGDFGDPIICPSRYGRISQPARGTRRQAMTVIAEILLNGPLTQYPSKRLFS
jgi:hypothetical protein